MLIKGRKAEAFARRPDAEIWAVLAFGEDDGQITDITRSLLAAWGSPAPVTYDDDTLRRDPGAVFDALEAVSLLGEPTVIRIRTNGDKSADTLCALLNTGEAEPQRFAGRLIVEAGALAPKSRLRARFESAKRAAALQLFADEADDVRNRIKSALLAEGAAIDPPALDEFAAGLPGNRALCCAEIEKLALYARGLGRSVTLHDVHALGASERDLGLSAFVAATLDGDTRGAVAQLDRAFAAGSNSISLLRALQSEAARLLMAHRLMAEGISDPGRSVRPPVWQADWPAFRDRMARWSPKRLARLLARIEETERGAKSASGTGDQLLRLLIIKVSRSGNQA